MRPSAKLREVTAYVNRGVTPSYTENDGIIVLNQKCIRDFRVSFTEARKTNPVIKSIPDEKFLKSYDILVNSTGVGTLGRTAQIKEVSEKITVDSHVTIVRPDTSKVDAIYLGFVLNWLQPLIELLAQGSTGQTELSRSKLGELDIPLPDLDEQKAIAKILSSLDDMIELNRRMNATLEAMARALFKAWFVDFEPVHANLKNRPSTSASPEIAKLFPSDLENGIPKGWEMMKLVDVCERITKGTTPKKFTEQGINFIKAESLTTDRGFIPEKFASIDDETNNSLLRSQLREDDVLFSIAGTIGRIARVVPDILPANTNQALAIIRADKGQIHPLFIELLLSRAEVQHSLTGMTVQAVQANLSLTVLGETEFALPPEKLFSDAFPLIDSVDTKIKENRRQNEMLKQTRDSLLPRLISGKLEVAK